MSNDGDEPVDVETVGSEEDPPRAETRNLPALNPWNYPPVEPSNLRTEQLEANEQRRCTARSSRTGERCRKWAVLGTEPGVCATHGASAPQVKRKARERVEMMSNRLMGKLIQFAFDDNKPPAVQLEAIKNSLDRAGLRPPVEVALSQQDTSPYEQIFEDIAGGSRAESRSRRGLPPLDEDSELPSSSRGYGASVESGSAGGSLPPTEADWPYTEGPRDQAAQAETFESQPPTQSDGNLRGRPAGFDREDSAEPVSRGHVRHVTGDAALAIAAEQLAIESPHRRYLRPSP